MSTYQLTLHYEIHVDARDISYLSPKRQQSPGVHKLNFKQHCLFFGESGEK